MINAPRYLLSKGATTPSRKNLPGKNTRQANSIINPKKNETANYCASEILVVGLSLAALAFRLVLLLMYFSIRRFNSLMKSL